MIYQSLFYLILLIYESNCQNDLVNVTISFYPTNYESIPETKSMSAWIISSVQNELKCLSEISMTGTANDTTNIYVYENAITDKLFLSHLLKLKNLTQYDSSNVMFSNDSLLLDSTRVNGLRAMIMKKDRKNAVDYKMQYYYNVIDQGGNSVTINSTNMKSESYWYYFLLFIFLKKNVIFQLLYRLWCKIKKKKIERNTFYVYACIFNDIF